MTKPSSRRPVLSAQTSMSASATSSRRRARWTARVSMPPRIVPVRNTFRGAPKLNSERWELSAESSHFHARPAPLPAGRATSTRYPGDLSLRAARAPDALRKVFNSEPSRLNIRTTSATSRTHSITNPNVASSVASTTFVSNQRSAVVNQVSTGIRDDLLYVCAIRFLPCACNS